MNTPASVVAEVSADPIAKSRKLQTAILQRMAPTGTQGRLATTLQVDDSTITRWKGDLERTCTILVLLGLKVVSEDKICVPPSEIGFLRAMYTRISQQAPWLLNEDGE